jgi:hypothetical protein
LSAYRAPPRLPQSPVGPGRRAPEPLAKLLEESYDRWGPIVKKIGFTADS